MLNRMLWCNSGENSLGGSGYNVLCEGVNTLDSAVNNSWGYSYISETSIYRVR